MDEGLRARPGMSCPPAARQICGSEWAADRRPYDSARPIGTPSYGRISPCLTIGPVDRMQTLFSHSSEYVCAALTMVPMVMKTKQENPWLATGAWLHNTVPFHPFSKMLTYSVSWHNIQLR